MTDRGITAILASRGQTHPVTAQSGAAAAFVRTGFAGDVYSDATHAIMVQNRDRVYTSNPPLDEEKRTEWERLWNFWFPFYASPIKDPDPDGMTAPQREQWFRSEAVKWQNFLNSREPRRFEAGTPTWMYVALGAVVLGGAAYAASK